MYEVRGQRGRECAANDPSSPRSSGLPALLGVSYKFTHEKEASKPVSSLLKITNSEKDISTSVSAPLGKQITAQFGVFADKLLNGLIQNVWKCCAGFIEGLQIFIKSRKHVL